MTPISLGIFASANTTVGTSFESIATVTVGSGGSSTITFSSIPSTYTHLQVRILVQGTSTFSAPFLPMQMNGVTGASYARHSIVGDGSSVSALGAANASVIVLPRFVDAGTPSYTNTFGAMIVDILDYTNTNKNKTVRAIGGFDANGNGEISLNSGVLLSTSAITSITFDTSGLAQYSHFALYGIKAAA